jgi:hypothetical protein
MTTGEVGLDDGETPSSGPTAERLTGLAVNGTGRLQSNSVAARLTETENRTQQIGNPGNVGLKA